MIRKIKSFLFAVIIFFSFQSFPSPCSEQLENIRSNLPICSEGGLVPETYPVGAIVVSDNGWRGRDSQFTSEVVEKVLTGAGKNKPLFILPVSDDTMERIRSRIDSLNIAKDQKEKYKKSLIQVETASYTWQQDYMNPFIDIETGQLLLREVKGYNRHGESFKKIIEESSECGIEAGPELTSNSRRIVNGQMGGNIDTLPGGICLLGDDHFENERSWTEYANQICSGSQEERIKVPTSWLAVGHTDEIMKVVRNKTAPSPCDFSVVIASPKKALELLKSNPNDAFVEFQPQSREPIKTMTSRRIEEYQGLRMLCKLSVENKLKNQEKLPPNNIRPVRGVSKIFEFKKIILNEALAGSVVSIAGDKQASDSADCSRLSNAEIFQIFSQDKDLRIYNELVQEKMDNLKKEVTEKLKRKFPQCEVDVIDTPDLFFGGAPVEKEKDKYELPNQFGLSILSNPANAISINDTIITPEPANGVFRKYIEDQYKKRGLNPEFIDTFDYAHQGFGNLHCSTTTIHMCKPRDGQ